MSLEEESRSMSRSSPSSGGSGKYAAAASWVPVAAVGSTPGGRRCACCWAGSGSGCC